MAIIKCKMCGGDITLAEDKTFGTCEYCGSTMTLPKVSDDQRAAAFNRGNHFRRMGEFDKALAVYERIVAEDDNDAEAHWCCALCRFGIEYVEDPATYEWLPTCHRASFDSFLEDVDYLAALEHSDGVTRRQYQKDAAKIAEVQRGILATSQNEKPFDVFICYKETDEDGNRTVDSTLAQDIYYQLTDKGYRVFFSRITLEDKAGAEYEPYIFAALNSAKVMIAVGTKAEYFNAVWVKNEWSRFLALMRKDRTKLLLPCYRDMDPYDLPEQLSVLQSYDMSKIGFIQDLIRGVAKVLDAEKEAAAPAPVKETVVVQQNAGGANPTALLKRGYMALEDRNWKNARSFFNRVLDMDAENADAFLGLAMADFNAGNIAELKDVYAKSDNAQFKGIEITIDADNNANLKRYRQYSGDDGLLLLKELDALREAERKRAQEINQKKAARQERKRNQQEQERNLKIQQLAEFRAKIAPVQNLLSVKSVTQCVDQHPVTSAFRASFAVGVLQNGNAIATKYTYPYTDRENAGQCNIESWSRIVAVATGRYHSIALKDDGTVISTSFRGHSDNNCGQCDVDSWKGIIAIAAGTYHSVGLRADGTVVSTIYRGQDSDNYGQCDTADWNDIVAIAAGGFHTVGLRADGTVVATGFPLACNVKGWKGVVSISAGYEQTAGVKEDGTVFLTNHSEEDLTAFTDIVAVALGNCHTAGLKIDGTVVTIGETNFCQCDVNHWRDIVAIAADSYCTVGIKKDGTILITQYKGRDKTFDKSVCGIYAVEDWKLFNYYESYISDKKKMLQSEKTHLIEELSNLRGLFAGKRRKEIEMRLSEIDMSLARM